MSPAHPSPPAGTLSGRPPVEHRRLGLDRRTFGLPLITIAIALLWTVVMPAINRSVDYDDPVRAGDAIWIGPNTSMAPPAGWGIVRGIRTGAPVRFRDFSSEVTTVSGDGITVATQAGKFAGSSAALLKQIDANDRIADSSGGFAVKGAPSTVTIDGRRGVAQEFRTLSGSGANFAFAHGGTGIVLTVVGPLTALERHEQTIGRMLASIDFDATREG